MQHSLEIVLASIGQATLPDLDRIAAAVDTRREEALKEWRTNLKAGEAIMIVNISPAAFKNLTGVVVGKAPGKKVQYTVRLDRHSTVALRYANHPRIKVPASIEEYETAVPAGCLVPYQR